MKERKTRAWLAKVSDVLRDVGDLADDGIRSVKTAAAAKGEQAKIDALYRRAGQLLFEEFEKTGRCDVRLRSIFQEIRSHKQTLERFGDEQRADDDVQSLRCTLVRVQSDPLYDMGRTRPCPCCGALLLDTAQVCAVCGTKL